MIDRCTEGAGEQSVSGLLRQALSVSRWFLLPDVAPYGPYESARAERADYKRIFGLCTMETPRAPGHDGIRTHGSQSLKAASKASIVTGLSARRSDLFSRQSDSPV